MAKLAIKGDKNKCNDILSFFERMGVKNEDVILPDNEMAFYYADEENNLSFTYGISGTEYKTFTLESLKKEFHLDDDLFNKVQKFEWNDFNNTLTFNEKIVFFGKNEKIMCINLDSKLFSDKILLDGDVDIEIIEENGKKYLCKRPHFPINIEECLDMLKDSDKDELINSVKNLTTLLKCRNAYWKLADNWRPDDNNKEQYDIHMFNNQPLFDDKGLKKSILTFPTVEMRDMFYYNFKGLIEKCKDFI